MTNEPNLNEQQKFPAWALRAGVISGAGTLAFFMTLVLLSVFGHSLPGNAKFPAISTLALGVAMAGAFLGGDAVAHGRLPIPLFREKPVEFSVVGGIAVFVIVFLLANAVYPKPDPPPNKLPTAEQEVSDLQDQVMILKGAWENSDLSPADRAQVLERAPKFAEALIAIDPFDLRPSWQIIKNEYTLYAFTMAASVYPSSTDQEKHEKQRLATEGLTAGATTLDLIAKTKHLYTRDANYTAAMHFVQDKEVEERTNYLTAICLCRLAQLGVDSGSAARAQEYLDRIPMTFLNKYPIATNTEFQNCIKQ